MSKLVVIDAELILKDLKKLRSKKNFAYNPDFYQGKIKAFEEVLSSALPLLEDNNIKKLNDVLDKALDQGDKLIKNLEKKQNKKKK